MSTTTKTAKLSPKTSMHLRRFKAFLKQEYNMTLIQNKKAKTTVMFDIIDSNDWTIGKIYLYKEVWCIDSQDNFWGRDIEGFIQDMIKWEGL